MLCAHHALTMQRAYTLCGLTTGLLEVDTIYSTYLLEVELDGARALEEGRPMPARQEIASRSHRDRIEIASRLHGRQCATLTVSAPAVRPTPPPPPSHLPPRPGYPGERRRSSGQSSAGEEVRRGGRAWGGRGRLALSAQAALHQLTEARVGAHLPR